jgi:cell division protein FtsN
MPGWIWMLFGLAVGLSVAVAIYINDRQPGSAGSRTAPVVTTKSKQPPRTKATKETDSSGRFTFYDMLPNFEVIIPEEDVEARSDNSGRPITTPGIYVLQAGSFSSYADADRVKAQLALLGIVSRIQKISIDDKVYHRVRIGPFKSLDQLNERRQQLRDSQVEVLVVRVGE